MQHNPNSNNSSQHHSNNHHQQQHQQQTHDEQIYSNQQFNQQQQYNPLIQGHQSSVQPGVPVHHPQQFGPHLTGFNTNSNINNNNNINSSSKLLLSGSKNMNSGGNAEPTKYGRDESLMLSSPPSINDGIGWCGYILLFLSYTLIVITVPFSLSICLKVVQEYERAVMFRLGRILPGGAKGPGMFFIVPCIDSYTKVDLRTVTFDVPPQEILTRDSVTVAVDAVVYFRIFDPIISVTNVEDAPKSTQLLAATTLRNVLGTRTLQEILADRESIAHSMQTSLDECTESWGVRVERVEVKDVRLPVQLQRAMAAEAEAAREARAKVIAAEGEHKASRALKEAAEIINESPIALQLRYLQTLTAIASERNSTIVFPIPIELLHSLPLHKS